MKLLTHTLTVFLAAFALGSNPSNAQSPSQGDESQASEAAPSTIVDASDGGIGPSNADLSGDSQRSEGSPSQKAEQALDRLVDSEGNSGFGVTATPGGMVVFGTDSGSGSAGSSGGSARTPASE